MSKAHAYGSAPTYTYSAFNHQDSGKYAVDH